MNEDSDISKQDFLYRLLAIEAGRREQIEWHRQMLFTSLARPDLKIDPAQLAKSREFLNVSENYEVKIRPSRGQYGPLSEDESVITDAAARDRAALTVCTLGWDSVDTADFYLTLFFDDDKLRPKVCEDLNISNEALMRLLFERIYETFFDWRGEYEAFFLKLRESDN